MPAWSPDGRTIAFARSPRSTPTAPARRTSRRSRPSPSAAAPSRRWPPRGRRRPGRWPATRPGRRTARACCSTCSATAPTDDFPPGDVWAVDRDGTRAGRVTATRGDDAQPHAQGPAPVRGQRRHRLDLHAGDPAARARHPQRHRRAPRQGRPGRQPSTSPSPACAPRRARCRRTPPPSSSTSRSPTPRPAPTCAPTRRGSPVPLASNLNAARGATVPNLVTVRLGADGRISLRNGLRLGAPDRRHRRLLHAGRRRRGLRGGRPEPHPRHPRRPRRGPRQARPWRRHRPAGHRRAAHGRRHAR